MKSKSDPLTGEPDAAMLVFEKTAVRFTILAGRFRACNPEKHRLSIEESEAFAEETSDALTALRSALSSLRRERPKDEAGDDAALWKTTCEAHCVVLDGIEEDLKPLFPALGVTDPGMLALTAAEEIKSLRAAVGSLRREREEARKQLEKWENDEASVCPEDVGFVEYIGVLNRRLEEARKDVGRWRALLASVLWTVDASDGHSMRAAFVKTPGHSEAYARKGLERFADDIRASAPSKEVSQ